MSMVLLLSSILLLCLLSYGLFVLLKVAISRASLSALEHFLEDGVWGAKLATRVVENADFHILAGHVGRFLCSFGAGVVAVLLFEILFDSFQSLVPWLPQSISSVGIICLLVFAIAFFAMLTVQFSKSIAVRAPERILLSLGWFCLLFSWLVSPVLIPVNALLAIFEQLGHMQSPPSERELTLSAEDLETVIEQSTQAGTLDDSESELLQGALRLSEIKVREIMTPRADIVAVGMDCTVQELVDVVGGAGFSRILVTGDQLDDIRGMLLTKDLIPFIGKDASQVALSSLIREVLFVDGERNGDEVLRRLRASQGHLGVVLDEHGGVDGIVTLEDLLEEIVGDIFDETDIAEEERDVTVTSSGELLVDGGTSLADLESDHGIELPEGEYDTVAGFIINHLGRIPEVGEKVYSNGVVLVVEQVDEHRITQLRISSKTDQDAA